MPWFKVDDQWHDHPKCLGLSFAAKGLWVHAGSWCAAKLTDGFVPKGALKVWGASPALAAELVAHGLWLALDQGWQFHEWTEHQPSKAAVLEKRSKVKDRVAKHRARNAVTDALPNKSNDACNVVTPALVTLPPSRPVPTRPEEREETTIHHAREGGRSLAAIGHDWMLSAAGRPFAPADWRQQLERIGMKPESERRAALVAIQACDFCRGNKLAVTPAYVLRHWDRYAAGNPPLKQVVRAAGGGKYAGPSEVAKPEDYAVKGDLKW